MMYRILIVDDNELVAKPLEKLLHACGYEVKVAHSGKKALEMIDDFKPKVMLIDLKMSGMDGFELARRIREEKSFLQIVLVAFTGSCQFKDRFKARKAGFDHYLKKPSDLIEIRRLLNAYDF